jgi:GDP-L-fucose synthase
MQPKIFVAGHNGMVGGAIMRALKRCGYDNLVVRSRSEVPLDDAGATSQFFAAERPDWVFLAAAKVGGIVANDQLSAEFIRDNLRIQVNVIDAAYKNGASRFLFLGSSCIYPKHAPQPISEDALMTGPLEPTNSAYAIAKIAGKEMCDAYRKQFGWNAFTIMPCNVYGLGDNFHPVHSHVAAGLLRRFHEAKLRGDEEVTIWGSGTPLREFIYSEDLGDAAVFLMENYDQGGMINCGSGDEISVADLAEKMKQVIGFSGSLRFDPSKPDGTPRKLMDNSRLFAMGWRPKTDLDSGLAQTYRWYCESGQQPAGGRGPE